MKLRGCSLCHHPFWKLRDMPLPSPLIIGRIQTTYYTHLTQSLYVQKASGQAPGLVLQLKKGLEISKILVSTSYNEIKSMIMLIMRARQWMVSGSPILSHLDLSVENDFYIHSVIQAVHIGRWWRMPATTQHFCKNRNRLYSCQTCSPSLLFESVFVTGCLFIKSP